MYKIGTHMKKILEILGLIFEIFRPLTSEEKEEAGILSAHEYQQGKRAN